MRELKYRILIYLAPFLAFLIRLIHKTIRWEKRVDYEIYFKGKMVALLHGNAIGVAMLCMDRGAYVLATRYRDGDISARLLSSLGYKVIRGSSEEGNPQKGGRVAFLKLLKVLKNGETVGITVDGPKGPYGKVKEGIIVLAQKSGVPIIPVYVAFDWCIKLRTWDRFIIPLPFSRAKVRIGNPIWVLKEDSVEAKREELEEVLFSLSLGKVSEKLLEPRES